jgi:hypothetical protein
MMKMEDRRFEKGDWPISFDIPVGQDRVTPAAIIEWLKRRGTFDLPNVKKRRTIRRWVRDNVVIAFGLVFGIGLLIGWLLRVH